MQAHWIERHPSLSQGDFTFLSTINGKNKTPHTPIDRPANALKLVSVEAMDDSVLFAPSIRSLRRMVALSERFQRPYGVQTAWDSPDKTVIFTLGTQTETQPIYRFNIDGTTLTVPVAEKPSLLRTSFTDEEASYKAIMAIVHAFPIPRMLDYPLTIIRKAVGGMLLPRIRPRLAMQPLTPAHAAEVDRAITRRVCSAIDAPYTATPILTLPIPMGGFDFPSIRAINAEVSTTVVMRALNHHLTPLRKMAAITIANWQCHSNDCTPPLQDITIPRKQPNLPIPSAWLTAAIHLEEAGLTIHDTDQSRWHMQSATHILNRAQVVKAMDAVTRRAINRIPFATDKFPWTAWITRVEQQTRSEDRTQATAARVVIGWALKVKLPNSLAIHDRAVFTPKDEAHKHLDAILASTFYDSPTDNFAAPSDYWATDGSSKDVGGVVKSTTAAVYGATTATFKLAGATSSIHGEIVGLIAALLNTSTSPSQQAIITDHLGSVRMIAQDRSASYDPFHDQGRPTAPYLACIAKAARGTDATVSHVKAHTGNEDDKSKLNDMADRLAWLAHRAGAATHVPTPTAYMPKYVVYSPHLQEYVPDRWKYMLQDHFTRTDYITLHPKQLLRLGATLDRQPAARGPYYYTRSPAARILTYQFLLRTGQFRTFARDGKYHSDDITCTHCNSDTPQTETHVFRYCPAYEKQRRDAYKKAKARHFIPEGPQQQAAIMVWKSFIKTLIWGTDGANYPLYWLGLIPPLPPQLAQAQAIEAIMSRSAWPPQLLGIYRWKVSQDIEADMRKEKQGQQSLTRRTRRETVDEGTENIE